MDLVMGVQHRVAGLFHQAFFEGVVRDGVVQQGLDHILDFGSRLSLDGMVDFGQVFENPLVLLVDDIDAGLELG
ncbi:hypothetical protein D3C86_2068650 [compost metagenome]